MFNIPEVKLGIVAVSRDCFPMTLSESRRIRVVEETKKLTNIFEVKTVVENEVDAMKALEEARGAGVNALVVYLGNFGPEGPETLMAQKFAASGLPVMFAAAAEETQENLFGGRGDAYCGMLNASYNLGLRGLNAHIPEYPVAAPDGAAKLIAEFEDIARVVIGVKNLKIFGFGPRPFDFLACNAPIKALYDLGVEIQENSELDLYGSFQAHENDARIPSVVSDMSKELGSGNKHPGVLERLAQYELTLMDWAERNKGASKYFAFANKCWPAFEGFFGSVPCYVNSRLASRGIPVACETDIYGALTEYIITAAAKMPPTLLDINNSVPEDMYKANPAVSKNYKLTDLFMGFHCGNTPSCYLKNPEMKYQLIMKRLIEPEGEPNITRGTLEGDMKGCDVTIFRLQSTADTRLKSYIAEGKILDLPTKSFGGIGIFAVHEMGRFYRHVLIEKRYPHHSGVAFKHAGKTLFAAMKMFGIEDIAFNRPAGMLYESENPFN